MAAAVDDFASTVYPGVGLSAPAYNAAVVTPSDTVDLTDVSRSIYVGGAGNITLVTAGGQTVLFSAIPAGTVLNIRASRIKATATTATLIVAMW